MRNKQGGYTLIELLTAVTVLGIISVIAITSYISQVKKSRRNDAIESILSISLAESRYRTSNSQYGTLAQVWGGVTTTAEGYYTLAISNISATSYTITATAQGTQASDTADGTSCTTLSFAQASGSVTKSPSACWPK